ncbi:MAG: anaerobic magnesium-protoporphyrin IX monomethyl ester cyclase [Hyphomicrobiaceae bacterium]
MIASRPCLLTRWRKNMRVALLIPGNLDNKKSQIFGELLRSPPPLGVASIAAQIRAAGHDTIVIDQFSEQLSVEATVERLSTFGVDAVGYSCLTPNLPMIEALNRELRIALPNIKLFAGNAHASEYPDSVLFNSSPIDVVAHDEGEETSVALLEAWESGASLDDVVGLSFVRDGKRVSTPRRAPLMELDEMARPAWDLMPIEHYRNSTQNMIPGDVQMLAVNLSRGCPWKCTYCAQNFYRTDTRRRDPDAVAAEVAWLVEEFGVTHFGFTDAVFPLTKDDAIGFADGIRKRGLAGKLKFLITTRVDLIDVEGFQALKEVGLHIAYLGVESGSDATLEAVAKRATRSQALDAVEKLRKVGVLSYGLFVLGLPGETQRELNETLEFALELDCDIATFSRMTPYAGAPLDREHRIVERPEYADTHDNWHVGADVKLPDTDLTIADVAAFQRWAMLRYFARPRVLLRILRGGYISPAQLLSGGALLLFHGLSTGITNLIERVSDRTTRIPEPL